MLSKKSPQNVLVVTILVFVCQEFRNGLAEQFWLRTFMRSQSHASWVCSQLKVWEKSTFQVAHSCVWQADMVSVCGRPQFLFMWAFPQDCLSIIMHGDWLPPEWALKGTKVKRCNAFRQTLEVTHHHSITCCWSHRPALIHEVVYTRWRSFGGIFGGWLPHSVCWFTCFVLFNMIYLEDLSILLTT